MAFLIIGVFAVFIGAGFHMERRDKRRLRDLYERAVQSTDATARDKLAKPYDDAADL